MVILALGIASAYYPMGQRTGKSSLEISYAFDGERLAIASINESHFDDRSYPTSCGFSLLVSDKTGVLYAGTYASSLDKGQPQEYNEHCRAMDYKPLRIWWE